MQKNSGFTLIELVIVIILTGILAATAIPKFIDSDGFEAQTYRDQLLQLLKTVQQQAMSCDDACRKGREANAYACNKVLIAPESSTEPNRFGIARLTFILGLILAATPKSILKPFPKFIF